MDYKNFINFPKETATAIFEELEKKFPDLVLFRSPSHDILPQMEAYRIGNEGPFMIETLLHHYKYNPPFLLWVECIEQVTESPAYNILDTLEMVAAVAAQTLKSQGKPDMFFDALAGATLIANRVVSGDSVIEYDIKITDKPKEPIV